MLLQSRQILLDKIAKAFMLMTEFYSYPISPIHVLSDLTLLQQHPVKKKRQNLFISTWKDKTKILKDRLRAGIFSMVWP